MMNFAENIKQVQYNDNIKENGLYATKVYSRGDIIRILEGNIESRPTKYSIDDYGIYINHSFDPTVYIQGKSVVAKRDIEINEEITFNYNESELKMAEPFEVCGVLVCGKREGDKFSEQVAKLLGFWDYEK